MTRQIESKKRRDFLGYCAATTALMSRFAAAWAAEPGAPGTATTDHALRKLAEDLEGDLLLPTDALYEPMRRIAWNVLVPERRPDLIVPAGGLSGRRRAHARLCPRAAAPGGRTRRRP